MEPVPALSWRWLLIIPIGAVMLAAVAGLTLSPARAAWEGGVLETAQIVLWGASGLGACLLALLFRGGSRAGRWLMLWLGVMSIGAMCREFDLHVLLNPETIGSLGVRYRIDWWLDPDVRLMRKIAWAMIGLGVGVLVIGSLIAGRPRLVRWLLAGDPATWLLAGVGIFLVLGWVIDDLLRGHVDLEIAQFVEESSELIGAALMPAVIGATFARERRGRPQTSRSHRADGGDGEGREHDDRERHADERGQPGDRH